MAWLNYHHLLYFWTVARLGSIAQASKELHLAQPTISTQLKTLEGSLGHKLFARQGRRLVLTETGQTAFRYADDIFRLGRELTETVTRGTGTAQASLAIGVADVIPKTVAERLLRPAIESKAAQRISCHEGPVPALLAKLALHELDVVLSDAPAPADVRVRAFNHLLGECGTTFFSTPKDAAALKKSFPKCLAHTPFVAPMPGTALRAQLDGYFDRAGITPNVVAEFDDSALMKVFGARGLGVFSTPSAIAQDVARQYDCVAIGTVPDVRQVFYAISVERRLRHPAVVAIADAARSTLFGEGV